MEPLAKTSSSKPHHGVIRAEAGSRTGRWVNKYLMITQSWRRKMLEQAACGTDVSAFN